MSSAVGVVQVIFALLLVLAALGAFAWFMRRLVPGQAGAASLLKVRGGVMVGPRERLVIVEVADTWLILGVAASSVNLVHSMPRPPAAAAAAGTEPEGWSRLLGRLARSRTPER